MLYLKHVAVQSFGENVVFVHKNCELYKVDDIRTSTRVEIHGGTKPLHAFLNVVEDENIVSPDEIGVNNEAFYDIGLPEGAKVTLLQSDIPQSLESVASKIEGNTLKSAEYIAIVNDIANGRYSNSDIAAFVTAFNSFATINEVVYLTQALCFGHKIYWDEENIVSDTATFGSVPSNSTEIITAAIVSAYGMPMLKSVILNPFAYLGEGHTMQVFTNLNINKVMLYQMIKETNGAIFNFDNLEGAQAIIKLRNMSQYLNLRDINMEIVLMMATKYCCGISHLVVDMPIGPQSIVNMPSKSAKARKSLEYVAKELGMTIDVAITDGSEPIGYGIGAVLEAKDVMKVLRVKDSASFDLAEKSLFMAAKVIEFDPRVKGGEGYNIAKQVLISGRALEAFEQIVDAQGKLQSADVGTFIREILAPKSGYIKSIDNKTLLKIATDAGAKEYAGSGIALMKKIGDRVAKGDVLYKIYSNKASDFSISCSLAEGTNGYEIDNN